MRRICLIQCDGGEAGHEDAPPLSTYNVAEPLGLLCLDAHLRRLGHEVLLLHPHVDPDVVLSHADMARRAAAFSPELIGFSAMTNQVPATARLAAALRRLLPGVPFVIGGDHFSSIPGDLEHYPEFAFAVCGEGENALPWLLANASGESSCRSTPPPGIYWREGQRVCGAGRTERITDLDPLAMPTRYAGMLKRSEVGMLMWPPRQTGMLSLFASRGCPYACSYCNARLIWGTGVHWRHPARVVEELRRAKDQFQINTAFFTDLTFNSDYDQVMALCAALADAKLGISWYVLLRPGNPTDRIRVDLPLLEALRSAGCMKVGFGVETVSPKVAKELRRAVGGEHVMQVARWIDSLGMLSKAFLIMGHPAENSDYYSYLRSYLDELNVDEIRLSFLTPFPGTPLWKSHRHELVGREAYHTYTTFRPILPHPQFTPRELEHVRLELLSSYYSSQCYLDRVVVKTSRFPRLDEAFRVFFDKLESELPPSERGWTSAPESCGIRTRSSTCASSPSEILRSPASSSSASMRPSTPAPCCCRKCCKR